MKKIIIAITTFVLSLASCQLPAMATSAPQVFGDGVQAAILQGCANEEETSGNGAGIRCILNLVVEIMTIGIGVLGVLGITIVGIQYLTAGGNEEKVRKAKRRMFEIIIGLVVYVLIYAILQFLRIDPN